MCKELLNVLGSSSMHTYYSWDKLSNIHRVSLIIPYLVNSVTKLGTSQCVINDSIMTFVLSIVRLIEANYILLEQLSSNFITESGNFHLQKFFVDGRIDKILNRQIFNVILFLTMQNKPVHAHKLL